MLYSEIIAVCSQIHTKHINTLCGQNLELLNVKLVVHIVTTEPTAEPPTTAAPLLPCYCLVLQFSSPQSLYHHNF